MFIGIMPINPVDVGDERSRTTSCDKAVKLSGSKPRNALPRKESEVNVVRVNSDDGNTPLRRLPLIASSL